MTPVIIHLDMNSYFASVEQQDHPEYRGKPLGVCEHLGGIIIAASVEAKKWGIKTGTPVWEAVKLYPKIILTHTSPERYRFYTRRLIKLVSDYADKVEVFSIDEVFLDLTKACNVKIPCPRYTVNGSAARIDKRLAAYGPLTENRKTIRAALPINELRETEENYLVPVDPYEEAIKIAKEIKQRMKTEVADYLRCSIGIGENKFIAKIASDMQKPDGLVVIRSSQGCHSGSYERSESCPESTPWIPDHPFPRTAIRGSEYKRVRDDTGFLELTKEDLYRKLKLTDVPGIGRRLEKRLNDLGIRTLKELRDYPKDRLVDMFGLPGYHLYSMGQLGSSEDPKGLKHLWTEEGGIADPSRSYNRKDAEDEEDEVKSMGHMYTLPKEFRDQKYLVPVLYKLSEMVARRLRRHNLTGNVIYFHIHDGSDECFGQSKRLPDYLYDGREIFMECMKIYESAGCRGQAPTGVKLIGVTVSGLVPPVNQLSLFGSEERKKRITKALDQINEKYGDGTLGRLPALLAKQVIRDSVGFGRIKEL